MSHSVTPLIVAAAEFTYERFGCLLGSGTNAGESLNYFEPDLWISVVHRFDECWNRGFCLRTKIGQRVRRVTTLFNV